MAQSVQKHMTQHLSNILHCLCVSLWLSLSISVFLFVSLCLCLYLSISVSISLSPHFFLLRHDSILHLVQSILLPQHSSDWNYRYKLTFSACTLNPSTVVFIISCLRKRMEHWRLWLEFDWHLKRNPGAGKWWTFSVSSGHHGNVLAFKEHSLASLSLRESCVFWCI